MQHSKNDNLDTIPATDEMNALTPNNPKTNNGAKSKGQTVEPMDETDNISCPSNFKSSSSSDSSISDQSRNTQDKPKCATLDEMAPNDDQDLTKYAWSQLSMLWGITQEARENVQLDTSKDHLVDPFENNVNMH